MIAKLNDAGRGRDLGSDRERQPVLPAAMATCSNRSHPARTLRSSRTAYSPVVGRLSFRSSRETDGTCAGHGDLWLSEFDQIAIISLDSITGLDPIAEGRFQMRFQGVGGREDFFEMDAGDASMAGCWLTYIGAAVDFYRRHQTWCPPVLVQPPPPGVD